jgi:HAE1 family hydrophobic/amphiphilic exporter-1
MLFVGIIILGVISLFRMPLELMPNTSFGEVSVIYEVRGGIPPDKIEKFVVKPVEDAVGGINNLKDVISISKDGRATIVLKFRANTDMDVAVMEVREKLAQVRHVLPKEVERPIVAQYEQEDIPVLVLGVTSHTRTTEEIRKIVDDDIKERLSRVEGIANVEVFGGRERKVIIEVIPEMLRAHSLSMAKVIGALNKANVSLLAGDVEGEESSFAIKTSGRFETIEDIENLGVGVSRQGSIIRLKDIGLVKDSYLEAENISRLNESNNVTIYIQKETLASTVKVSEDVAEEVSKLKQTLSARDLIISTIKDDADYIKKALNSMKFSLVLGALLASLILIVFLKNVRVTSIIFLSIPVSIFLAVTLLFFSRITLNVMTIGGLALGVGMLLDNSIVVIENIFKTKQSSNPGEDSIVEGAGQVLVPIVAGTLTTVVVFLPLVFLSAEIKHLQSDMALAITFSLVASLFVSLSLIPILFHRLKISPQLNEERPSFLTGSYKRTLQSILRFRHFYTGLALSLFAAAVLIFIRIDMNLFEAQEENKFTINVELPTGAKLEVSDEKVKQVESLLTELKEVKTVSSKIEKWSSKVYVTLHPASKRKRTKEEIKAALRPKFKVIQPAFIYFQESQEMAAKEVFVELYGQDYDVLKELAMTVGGYVKGIPRMEDVKIRMREGRPEKQVILDRKKVALNGLNISYIAENLHARLRGLVATRYHEKAKEIETIVRQLKDSITDFTHLYRIEFMNLLGTWTRLSQVAEFIEGKAPSEIWRKNKKRMVQVSGSRNKISLGRAVHEINRVLKSAKFPVDYFYEIGGDYEIMVKSKKELTLALVMTVVLVYLVLASMFESYLQPFIIMISVPLSFIGVVTALKIAKLPVSVGVIMGIIMLAGIVVNNAIIMVDRINSLKSEGRVDYIVAGCIQRLRPILMTSITTILGLLPLALKGGEGSGLWRPLSVTVIGGLLSSTFLVLFIVPCIYGIYRGTKTINGDVLNFDKWGRP